MNYLRLFKQRIFSEITTVPCIVQESYYPSLDGFRTIAVMMVIFYHFGVNHYLHPFGILINGDMGVNIFFLLSGFLITTLLLKEKVTQGCISLKHFYTRRALRILPAAYLFLLIWVILNAVYHFGISTPNFMASFLFYKNFPYQNDPYTGHFWSLAAEVQFYLVFPALLVAGVNRYTVGLLAVVMVVPLIALAGFHHSGTYSISFEKDLTQVIRYVFWKGPFIILIGSLAAMLLFKGVIRINNSNYFLSFGLFVAALVISSKSFLLYTEYVSEYIAAFLIAWAILLSLAGTDLLSKILSNPVFAGVGKISYSLYIWQQLFIGRSFWQPWMQVFNGYSRGTNIIIKLVLVFIISLASWYLVEANFLKLKRRCE